MNKERHLMRHVKLESKSLSCTVDAERGARIIRLSIQGEDVFKFNENKNPNGPGEGVLALIPCVHHASLSELVWHGTGHPALNTQVSAEQFDGGLGWQSPWQILEQEEDWVLLGFEHRAQKNWPWLFDASQVIRVHEETLFLTLSLTNQSNVAAPAGLGWSLSFPIVPRDQLTIKAKRQMELNHLGVKERAIKEVKQGNSKSSEGFDGALHELCEGISYGEWDGAASLKTDTYRVSLQSNLKTIQACPIDERASLLLKAFDVPYDVMRHAAAPQMLAPGESTSIEMCLKFEGSKNIH